MAVPRRFTNGITNAAGGTNTGMFIMPDPTKVHVFFDDFDRYVAGDWTITNSGAATEALTDADGGRLLLTHVATTDDDTCFLNKVGESFLVASGKKMWFKALLRVSDATQSELVMGLQITDTTPLAVTDGIYFQKDDGDTNIDFHVTKNSSSSSISGIGTLANATDITVGFYYDGGTKVYAYVNDVEVGTVTPGTNLPDDEVLTISFGSQTGDALGTKTMTIDYIFAAKERG